MPRTTALCACLFAVPLPEADGQVCPTYFEAAQTRWTHTGWHPREALSSSVRAHRHVGAHARAGSRALGPMPWGPAHWGPELLLPGSVCVATALSPLPWAAPARGCAYGGSGPCGIGSRPVNTDAPPAREEACRWWAGRAVRRLRSRAGGTGGGAGQRAFHPQMQGGPLRDAGSGGGWHDFPAAGGRPAGTQSGPKRTEPWPPCRAAHLTMGVLLQASPPVISWSACGPSAHCSKARWPGVLAGSGVRRGAHLPLTDSCGRSTVPRVPSSPHRWAYGAAEARR